MVHEVSSRKDLLAAAGHVSQTAPPRHSIKRDAEEQGADPQTDKVEEKDLQHALSRVREVFHKADPRLEFSVDTDLDRVVVKVVNGESGEVIRQIPPKEVLELAKSLEAPTGLLLHQKV